MNTFLWAAQVALAVIFLAHGLLFLFPPGALRKIRKRNPLPAAFMRFIFVAEVLAAPGLILPGWTGILPWLTSLAATGLVPISGGAAVFHLSRGEMPPATFALVLLALAAFVAYARWFALPL